MSTHSGNVIAQVLNEIHDHSISPPTNNALVYGFDGSAKQILKTDSGGRAIISPVTVFAVVNTGASNSNITLNPSPNFIGIVTVANPSSFSGNVTLNPGPNQIGSVTISNNPTLGVGTNYIGLASIQGNVNATQAGNWSASINGLISLASGTEMRSLATILNFPATQAVTQSGTWNVGITGLVSLASGTEVRTRNVSNVTLNASDAFIGLATVVQANQPALVASSAYIGLASVNIGGSLPALSVGSNFIGLASVQGNVNATQAGTWTAGINSNVTLNPSPNFIGLTTIVPTYLSTYTSLSTVISATGNSTIFVPPSNQRWILKDLFMSSLGRSEVEIRSGANTVIPFTSIATTGGYISNFGDSGLRGKAVNDSFVVGLNGAATIAVMVNVRFE